MQRQQPLGCLNEQRYVDLALDVSLGCYTIHEIITYNLGSARRCLGDGPVLIGTKS